MRKPCNPAIFYAYENQTHEVIKSKNKSQPEKFCNELPNTFKVKKLTRYIDEIVEKEIDVTTSYKIWFEIGCALANEFDREGRKYFHLISQFHSKYNENESDALYTSCLKGSYTYTLGTFYYYCHEEGIGVK